MSLPSEPVNAAVSKEAALTQLDRILTSPIFFKSRRLTKFLRFVVTAVAQGDSEQVKEYAIGVEVFDRGTGFDPRINPIVRVQAAKLRSKLLEYYSGEGAQDPIVISIPKGTYAAVFEISAACAKPSDNVRASIAVLPFVNMSKEPENEYFSDGLTEEIINVLATIPGLQVVARTSVFAFKGVAKDIREIGAQLGVESVVEGSVRRSGDKFRITVQLIDVKSGYHLFSGTYQRQLSEVFTLQDELAQAVVAEIMPQSKPAIDFWIRTKDSVNPASYDLYLKGMYALSNKFMDLPKSIELFREALRLDPRFAPAWAGLGECYFTLAWFYLMPSENAIPQSREAALRATELDSRLAQAHSSLGLVNCVFDWKWAEAEARFLHAIELQPGSAKNYQFFPFLCYLPQRRYEEAVALVQRGLPLDPYNASLNAIATYIYAIAGRYEDAMRQHAFALEIGPEVATVWATGGLAYELQNQGTKAIQAYRRACELSNDAPGSLSNLGHALARSGDRRESQRILKRLVSLGDLMAVDIAKVHIGLGNEQEALRWLEAAFEGRDIHLITVPMDPRFASLKLQQRFKRLVEGMGLTTQSSSDST